MPRKSKLSDQVRAAVDRSGVSRYRICLDAEIDQAAMSRFMAAKAGLSMDALDRLAAVLDLRIEAKRVSRRKAR